MADLTTMLALSCYVFIFAAAIRLRYSHPHIKRAYRVPFGNFGMWVICVIGIFASLFTVMIGFVPPTKIEVGNIWFYELFYVVDQ